MNATAESFCVVVVCWYKKKANANEKKSTQKRTKATVHFSAAPSIRRQTSQNNNTLIIIVYILKRSHIYIVQVVFLLSESCLKVVCARIYFDLKNMGVLPSYCLSTKKKLARYFWFDLLLLFVVCLFDN